MPGIRLGCSFLPSLPGYTVPLTFPSVTGMKLMAVKFLKNFVLCAGAALEIEDRSIIEAGRARGKPGGLLRSPQERFYQYVVWKATHAKWDVEVEKDAHDLVILNPYDNRKYLCVFEMKNWFSENGMREVRPIKNDIDVKLKNCDSPNSAFILFSANPRGAMDEQLRWLEDRIFDSSPPSRETYCFTTVSPHSPSVECEFWIAGWPIKSGPIFSNL